MAKAKQTIKAGICGFTTTLVASSDDGETVKIEVESDCPNIKALAEALPELDAYGELAAGYEGELWTAAKSSITKCCVGCVVPVGIYKAMQVAAGLALPADSIISFEKN